MRGEATVTTERPPGVRHLAEHAANRSGTTAAPLKAIETHYNGYRFRSRLEARWAVFLDTLGVPYQYEPQGFDLGGLAYLPDFWLPDQRCWLEIKPDDNGWYQWDAAGRQYVPSDDPRAPATDEDFLLACTCAHRLAESSGFPVFMLFGDLCPLGFDSGGRVRGSNKVWRPDGSHDDGCSEWAECPLCLALGIGHCGQHECCDCVCYERFEPPDRPGNWGRCRRCGASDGGEPKKPHRPWMSSQTGNLAGAYQAARSARFEHGETPRR
jgi:hypothetical protein